MQSELPGGDASFAALEAELQRLNEENGALRAALQKQDSIEGARMRAAEEMRAELLALRRWKSEVTVLPDGCVPLPVEPSEAHIAALAGYERILPAYVGAKEHADAVLAKRYRALVEVVAKSAPVSQAHKAPSGLVGPLREAERLIQLSFSRLSQLGPGGRGAWLGAWAEYQALGQLVCKTRALADRVEKRAGGKA